jgi:hypothetical protein
MTRKEKNSLKTGMFTYQRLWVRILKPSSVTLLLITQAYKMKILRISGFLNFPSSGIVETRKHDVSESGSVSVLR